MASVEPGQEFAGYLIGEVLRHGGMGTVYRATQLALDRPVALKVIASDLPLDEAARQRFRRETRALAAVDHPNVIVPFETGELDGRPYLSMRLVDGSDLRDLIALEGALAADRVAAIVAQVAAALDAAHACGLVHRDVKPANILIERRDGVEHAYLSDFGLSRLVGRSEAQITRAGHWVGTLDYVAPEQIDDGLVDGRADVYALGCVLFHAFTGHVPFPRDGGAAKLWAHLHEPPPSARELRPELPAALDAALARAMSKEPQDRQRSAGELGCEVLDATGGGARVAPPATALTETLASGAGGRTPAPRLRRLRALGWRRVAAAGAVLGAAAVGGTMLVGEDAEQVAGRGFVGGQLRHDADVPERLRPAVVRAANTCRDPEVTPALIAGMLDAESGFDPRHRSPDTNEFGIARWTPSVFRGWAIDADGGGASVFSAADSIASLGAYLCAIGPRVAEARGDRALLRAAAFRVGSSRVRDAGGVPREAAGYIEKVESAARRYARPRDD